jgi:hypothetical protein
MAKALLDVLIHFLICGTCGHQTSSLNAYRTAAAMLAHLRYAHSEPA